MRHDRSLMKTLISSSFSFLLMILLVVLFVDFGLNLGFFNSKSIISTINKTYYYDKVYAETNKRAEEIVLQAGLPVTVLTDVITLDRVYIGGNNYVNGTLHGKKPKINTDKLKSDLKNNIDKYLKEQQITSTSQIATTQAKVVSRIEKVYLTGVQLKYVDLLMAWKAHLGRIMLILLPLLIFIGAFLCYFLLRLHKNRHRGLRYMNYALISASILILAAAEFLLCRKDYEKLNVVPGYYKDFLIAYYRWDIQVFLYIGGIGILMAVVLISFTRFLRNKAANS